jgi:hypothetical protein
MAQIESYKKSYELKYDKLKEKAKVEVKSIDQAVESAEEKMMKFYAKKESTVNKVYQKAMYVCPTPPTDEELLLKNNFLRTHRVQYR